MVKNSVTK